MNLFTMWQAGGRNHPSARQGPSGHGDLVFSSTVLREAVTAAEKDEEFATSMPTGGMEYWTKRSTALDVAGPGAEPYRRRQRRGLVNDASLSGSMKVC